MVFILPQKYFSNRNIFQSNVYYPLQSQVQPEPEQPDPIMRNIQKDTSVEDLQPSDGGEMTGQGFIVKGAGNRKQVKSEKLRKFASLKL